MESMSYDFKFNENDINFNEVMRFIKKNYNKKVSWRSDLQNFEKDKNIELIRNKLLKREIQANELVLKKCFLFKNS